MSLWRRVYLGIIRRPFHSAILVFTMIIMSVFFMAGNFIRDLAGAYYDYFVESHGYSLFVYQPDGKKFDVSLLDKIKKMEHVKGCNTWFELETKPVDFKNVPYTSDMKISQVGNEEMVRLIFNNETSLYKTFRNNQMRLAEGSYPSGDGILIDRCLAEKNNIHIGETVAVYSEYEKHAVEFHVSGIYETKKAPVEEAETEGGDQYGTMATSCLFVDMESYPHFGEIEERENYVFVYADQYKNISSIEEQIVGCEEFADGYAIQNMVENDMNANEAVINTLNRTADGMLKLIFVTSIVILFLLTVLWMRKHDYETGIYIGLGVEKWKILFVFVGEVIVLIVIAMLLCMGIGMLLVPQISTEHMKGMVDFLMPAAPSVMETALQDFLIKNSFSMGTLMKAVCVTGGVAGLAAVLSGVVVMQYNPVKLLKGGKF